MFQSLTFTHQAEAELRHVLIKPHDAHERRCYTVGYTILITGSRLKHDRGVETEGCNVQAPKPLGGTGYVKRLKVIYINTFAKTYLWLHFNHHPLP